jgi:hypothetical protein
MGNSLINLDGKAPESSEYKKIKVSEDIHEGVVEDIKLAEGIDFDTGEKVPKLILNVRLSEGLISKWFSPKVSKGSGRYSSSEGYVILEKAGLLNTLKEVASQFKEGKEGMEQLGKFFNQYLKGKKVKILTKTIVPKGGTVDEAYSKIDKIVAFY